MSAITIIRYAPTRLSTSIPTPSSSRCISTSIQSYAAVKGKAKPVLKKKVQGSFMKKTPKAGATGGGDNAPRAGGLNFRYSLAHDVPELNDLIELRPEAYVPSNIGKATSFSPRTFDQLKQFGLPTRIEKELSSGTPTSVIRQSTVNLAKGVESAKSSSSKGSRRIIAGERGSGKSMILLQTVSYCLESGWIVLYIPKATKWIDSTAPYAYDATSKSFHQPTLAQAQLKSLLEVNSDKLRKLSLERKVVLNGKEMGKDAKLVDLIEVGLRDEGVAVECFEVVLEILGAQTQFPVLLAVDEVQALFRQSTYRSSDFTPLEAYHLSAPRLALEYITGRKAFKRGQILTSLSYSSPSHLPPPHLLSSLSLPLPLPLSPQTKQSLDAQHLANSSSGLKIEQLDYGMSLVEATGVFEVWSKKGWTVSSDDLFLGTFAGSAGNPQEFVRGLTNTQQAFNTH